MECGDWDGRFFDSLDELRDFASDLVIANEENPALKFYGRRFEVMDAATCSTIRDTAGSNRAAGGFLLHFPSKNQTP